MLLSLLRQLTVRATQVEVFSAKTSQLHCADAFESNVPAWRMGMLGPALQARKKMGAVGCMHHTVAQTVTSASVLHTKENSSMWQRRQ